MISGAPAIVICPCARFPRQAWHFGNAIRADVLTTGRKCPLSGAMNGLNRICGICREIIR
jgi:hypothetical protein